VPYYKTHLSKYGTQLDDYFAAVPPEYWFVTFDIMRCRACEMVYVPETYEGLADAVENHPVFLTKIVKPYLGLTQKKVDPHYSKKIMTEPVNNLSPFEYHQRIILGLIKSHLPDKSMVSFLDLGSNMGGFAQMVRLNFQNIEVWGCETNEFYAKESKVRYPNLNLMEKPLSSHHTMHEFDFIHASDLIEHIWNLDDFILSIKKNLKSNGLVMLVTPNVECVESKKTGIQWWGYIVPHHVQLFCQNSLKALMKRFGFTEIKSKPLQQEFWAIYKAGCLSEV
jgi:2-polyprenyl-3-methyl-5-hydroxy-6-metoxy-1,4-benzoquinol methylase